MLPYYSLWVEEIAQDGDTNTNHAADANNASQARKPSAPADICTEYTN